MSDKVNTWERFLDSLSTEGGHIVLWIMILALGAVFVKMGIEYGHEIMVGAVAGLGISLKSGTRSNNTRLNSTTTTTVASTGAVTTFPDDAFGFVASSDLAVGHERTTETHVARAWELLTRHTAQLSSSR